MPFGDKFNKMKQWSLQKVGQVPKREEPAEFVSMVEGLKSTKKQLTELREACAKMHERELRNIASREAVAAAFARINSDANRTQLVALVPAFTKSAHAETDWACSFKVNIVDCLTNIVEVQVKAAEKALKNLSDARLDFDAKEASFRSVVDSKKANAADVDSAKRKTDDAEAAYNDAKEQVTEACVQVDRARDEFMSQKLTVVITALGTYGACLANNAQTYIEETQ
jgi:hypothetical protein